MDPIWDTYSIYKSNGQISVVSSSFRHGWSCDVGGHGEVEGVCPRHSGEMGSWVSLGCPVGS